MFLRNPRVLLACIGIAFAVLAALSLRYFLQYQPLAALAGGLTDQARQAALEADDVQVVGRSDGKIQWRMAARSVTLSRDRRILAISGIHQGALYTPDGRPSVSLTADEASYTTPFGVLGLGGAGALRVEGNVEAHVLSAAHPSLSTRLIQWDGTSNALVCPGAVIATLPRLTVTAGNARYDSPPGAPTHGIMHLDGGISARFSSTRGLATLNCSGLTWVADGQNAQTTGPVTAGIPGGLGTAQADSITVNTHTGDLSGHGLRGTLRLSREVQ